MRTSELGNKQRSIDPVQASAIPLAGLSAWQALFNWGGLKAGTRVLIQAAAGGVGSFAVQPAKWKGAHVVGTASEPNPAFLRELGAEEVIDYTKTDFEQVVRDVDVVVGHHSRPDAGPLLERAEERRHPGDNSRPAVARGRGPTRRKGGRSFCPAEPGGTGGEITRQVESGKLRPVIETVLPLALAARAHEMNQTLHTRGKIVLRVA